MYLWYGSSDDANFNLNNLIYEVFKSNIDIMWLVGLMTMIL